MSEKLIPKKIHYFWFGGAEKSASVLRCIDSWKKSCPDFEIIEWNDNNYDIHKHPFMEKAFKDKKWAFVSDYIRLKALTEQGGFYLDTDVRVLKSFDDLLCENAILGFEMGMFIGTAFIACKKDFPFFKKYLKSYENRNFINGNSFDTTTNVQTISEILEKAGLTLDGKEQFVENIHVFPCRMRAYSQRLCVRWSGSN